MQKSPRILVFRFSALGDVAMTIPVLWSLKKQYPGCEILFVSRPFARDLIEPIEGVRFFSVNFNKDFKGLRGVVKLFIALRKDGKWNLIADLHGVMRTWILTLLFTLSGVKTITIVKGRKEKKALTRKKNKVFKPLGSTIDRYLDVFEKGGFFMKLLPFPGKKIYAGDGEVPHDAVLMPGKKIGVAPFAKHQWKMWPEEKMIRLLSILDTKGVQMFLFGGGGPEKEKLDVWASELVNGHNMAGKLSLSDELKVMAGLDLMISMDSANMHLASLVQTPVISIWGATHPYAGFYGFQQGPENAVQVELPCRPCSVFGNKPCYRGDFACMNYISEEMVVEAIYKLAMFNKTL